MSELVSSVLKSLLTFLSLLSFCIECLYLFVDSWVNHILLANHIFISNQDSIYYQ